MGEFFAELTDGFHGQKTLQQFSHMSLSHREFSNTHGSCSLRAKISPDCNE